MYNGDICIMKKIIAAAAGVMMAAIVSIQSLAAGYWYQLGDGTWRYRGESGQDVTDFQLINGKWYFFSTREDATKGNMIVGKHIIGNKIYYFNPNDGGAMVRNTDFQGYHHDEYGTIVTDSGIPYQIETQEYNSAYRLNDKIPLDTAVDLATGAQGTPAAGSRTYLDQNSNISTEDDSVKRGANNPDYGNYSGLTDDEKAELKEKINEFKEQYITDDMSDFDKEIMIIKWIVENCTYAYNNPTAYNCIVEGKAQCAGFADAFLQMAKACGLTARYVSNGEDHAWNLIKLDGDWYHVDVTWEAPGAHTAYGFGGLENKYINLTDDEIRRYDHHKIWNEQPKARGTKYGHDYVTEYLNDESHDTKQYSVYEQKKAEEKATPHSYTIHFVDKDTGKELSTQTGESTYNEKVYYEVPEYYEAFIRDEKTKVNTGKSVFAKTYLQNYGMKDTDVTVAIAVPDAIKQTLIRKGILPADS